MEWIHDEYSVVEKHAQTMLQLVKVGIDWKCGELEQIVNIPVTQIVEEITEVNIPVTQIVEEITEVNIPVPQNVEEIAEVSQSSYSDCGRDRRGEQILDSVEEHPESLL